MNSSDGDIEIKRNEILHYGEPFAGTKKREYRQVYSDNIRKVFENHNANYDNVSDGLPHTNIALMGKPQSGKGALLHTLWQSLHGDNAICTALVGSGDQHQTTKVHYISLGDSNTENLPKKISLTDTPGFEENAAQKKSQQYQDGLFEKLILGQLRNFEITSPIPVNNTRVDPKDAIHAIIFVVDIRTVATDSFAKLKELKKDAERRNIFPIVVLTCSDLYSANVKQNPVSVLTDTAIQEVVHNFHVKTGFEKTNIYPLQNITESRPYLPYVKSRVLEVLEAALDQSEKHFRAVADDLNLEKQSQNALHLNAQFVVQ